MSCRTQVTDCWPLSTARQQGGGAPQAQTVSVSFSASSRSSASVIFELIRRWFVRLRTFVCLLSSSLQGEAGAGRTREVHKRRGAGIA